jgi:predicted enzyme related to lactoylglutathione lyase
VLRGLTTITYVATDVAAAADWYTELLGVRPYFTRPDAAAPAYVEFRIGDHQAELGIVDARWTTGGQADRPSGTITYWAVDDPQAAYARLLSLGATPHEPPTERGQGFVTAAVVDPFGNVLGVMYNEHYLDMLETRAKAPRRATRPTT